MIRVSANSSADWNECIAFLDDGMTIYLQDFLFVGLSLDEQDGVCSYGEASA